MVRCNRMDGVDCGCCGFRTRADDSVVIADGGKSAVYGRRWGRGSPLRLVEEDVDGGRGSENCVFRVVKVGAVDDVVVANERARMLT